MILMKIFFAVLIIICVIFYIMYLWDFALVLLITVIAVPIIMFIATLIAKKNIRVDFALKSDTALKNENFPVQIKITNNSIFPVGKAEAYIEYSNLFSPETSVFNLLLPIQARNSQNISFQLNSKYCGIIRIKCACINIYDPLRIFRFRIGRNIDTEVAVMPEGFEISGHICSTDRVNEESNIFSEYKAGDDPSEIFDLRSYNQGDKLNRIHWKLSSKRDEFIVKDYSLPVDTPCMLFLDMRISSDYRLPVADTLIETFVSISRFMLENERSHSLVYYNSVEGDFVEKSIADTDSLTETIREIILSANENAVCRSPKDYFADVPDLAMSSFAFITSDSDPELFEYIGDNTDADIKNAVVVVTSPKEAENLSAGGSDINIIPVLIGRITSSIKDIEL
ncbi:MAG: DUF58 domain-containing protein [Ruminococcus flavefaciens]|nr:DUF58 domain-containing protein [Ruminococcus flavefaciens]MCM1232624.1 DUF58 domain-containing protein [Ruminococcus flavefaciens]